MNVKGDDVPAGLFLYLVCGVMTLVFMGVFGGIASTAPLAACIGIVLVWPLFVIKYLIIGIVMVVSSTWTILF